MYRKILIILIFLFLTAGIFGLAAGEIWAGSSFSFHLSLTPNTGTISKGGVLNSAVNLSLYSSSSSNRRHRVTLFAAVQPKGVKIRFRPSSCSLPCSSKITISISEGAENRNYSIPIIATGKGVTRIATYYLTVSPPPASLKTPRFISPLDNSTVSSLTPFLDWFKVSGAKTYYWTIGNESGTATRSSLTVPSGILKYNTKYDWKVKACTDSSQDECSGWSGKRSFTTPKSREALLTTFQVQLAEIRAALLRLQEGLSKLIGSMGI